MSEQQTTAPTNTFLPIDVEDPYIQLLVCHIIGLLEKAFSKEAHELYLTDVHCMETVHYYLKKREELEELERLARDEFLEEFGGDKIFREIAGSVKEFIFANEPKDVQEIKKRPPQSEEQYDYLYLEEIVDVMQQMFRAEFKHMRRVAPSLLLNQLNLGALRDWIQDKKFDITPLSAPPILIKRYWEQITASAKRCEEVYEHLSDPLKVSIPHIDWYLLSVWGVNWLRLSWLRNPAIHSRICVQKLGIEEEKEKLFRQGFLKKQGLVEEPKEESKTEESKEETSAEASEGTTEEAEELSAEELEEKEEEQKLVQEEVEQERACHKYFEEINHFLCEMSTSKTVGGMGELQAALYYFLKQKALSTDTKSS